MLLYLGAQGSADASLAQLDRVTGYEPVGRGFESLPAHRKASVERQEPFCFACNSICGTAGDLSKNPQKTLDIQLEICYIEKNSALCVTENGGFDYEA